MRPIATEIVRQLQAAGHEAHFVGGCVRDQLLGLEPQDYDIASSAVPEQMESLFPHTVPVGRQFGEVVVIEQGIPLTVAGRTENTRRSAGLGAKTVGRNVTRGHQTTFLPAAGDYLGRVVGGIR